MQSINHQESIFVSTPETVFPVLGAGTVTLEVNTGDDGWQPVKNLTEPYRLDFNPGTEWRVTLTNDAKCYRKI